MDELGRRIGILAALLFSSGAALAAESANHRYLDQVTGFTLEVPKNWERRDPAAMIQELIDTNTQFWGRRSAGVESAQVLLVALPPHAGPSNARPAVVCSAAPTPLGQQAAPSEAKRHLQNAVNSTFGRAGAAVSDPQQISPSGHEAYRITATAKSDPSAEFFGAIREGVFIQCSGMYDQRSREAIRGVLDSIRFEKVAATASAPLTRTPVDAEALRAVFLKVGCGAPGSSLANYARQRDRGVTKVDIPPDRFIVLGPPQLTSAEIGTYHTELVDDVYQGAGMSAEDFLLYGNAKCRAVLERRETGSIAVYQQKLEACVAKKKDRFACSAKLWKW